MNSFEIDKIISIDHKFSTHFVDGTCDLDYFYFVDNISNYIYIFTKDGKYFTSIKTTKIFSKLVYDYCDDAFFAYSDKEKYILYKLDKYMNIIDNTDLHLCRVKNNFLQSLVYNKAHNSLIVTIDNEILEIDKCCNLLNCISCCDIKPNNIYYFDPYIFDITKNNNSLRISNSLNDIHHIKLPSQFEYKSIICTDFSCSGYFKVLLLSHSCKCNYLISVLIDMNRLDNCNNCCVNLRHKCCEDKSCIKNDSCCPKTDIIQSIALIESSLAHILNAEGEKLQKAIHFSCSIEDLLKINNSIQKTINNISNLEVQLYSKLSLILELNDGNK